MVPLEGFGTVSYLPSTVTQNRPLWRMMPMYGATQS